ncbi:MAG: hypothetical protein WBZ36_05065 [Candidatus Nitrosopolaris sp.]
MEDYLIPENDVKEYQKRSYEDLSSEFQRQYPRVVQLIELMYNRLTLVDKLSQKEAVAKIYNDHRHLSGFSKRNIRRNLPFENSSVPRRIRPSWPKNSITKSDDAPKLSVAIQEQNQNALTGQTTTNQLEEAPTEKLHYISDPNHGIDHNDVYAENAELKEVITRQIAFTTANEISLHEIEFTIPKEKYPNLEEAMQKSRDSVYVVFDKSGILERAIPDIYRGK